MRALPVRRLAPGALCAALLAGITAPAAVAADTAPEHHRASSSAALLERVGAVAGDERALAPVVALVRAALDADGGRLPAAEAGKLGEAAKAALAEAADEDPVVMTGTTTVTTDDTHLVITGDDLTEEELTVLREALDSLLDLLRPGPDTGTATEEGTGTDAATEEGTGADAATGASAGESAEPATEAEESTGTSAQTDAETEAQADPEAAQAPSPVDGLLSRVDDLVSALTGARPQASVLPAPAGPAQPPLLPGVTFPALTSLLLPPSASS
ncbi:hypothetical protein ABTY20_17975 [Streptomyces sp. NPDC126497]|uniref:hypothetical protein n=1 Tax=Streptomyces sp. NPDC126497 TaxID=3155313 RepID=UPI003316BCCA